MYTYNYIACVHKYTMHTIKSETVPVSTYNYIKQPVLLWITKTVSDFDWRSGNKHLDFRPFPV